LENLKTINLTAEEYDAAQHNRYQRLVIGQLSLEMSTEGKFTFSQECIDEISNAAKEATLKTGATEEVANTASEAAAEAARNTF
jgi:hypothetical protein